MPVPTREMISVGVIVTIGAVLLFVGFVAAFVWIEFLRPVAKPFVQSEWKPAYCAAFLSRDNVPLAVCNDSFHPVYDVVPAGYEGMLSGCVITNGRVRGCHPSKM